MYTEESMPKNVKDKCESHADKMSHFIMNSFHSCFPNKGFIHTGW